MPVFSTCSRHSMGSAGCEAAWLKSQPAIEWPHATESAPSTTPSLGRSRSGARFGLLSADRQAGLNVVPLRSMACMRIARRRASATRALRMVERRAIANAQSFSLSGCFQRVSMTLAAS